MSRQNVMFMHMAQETLMLLLLGVSSNIVAFDGSGEEPGSLWGMGSGWGSHFGHLLGNAGRLALLREAVLVQKAHPVWLWSPDGKGVETYLEPVSSCDRRAANATLRADQILHCRGCDDDALAPVLADTAAAAVLAPVALPPVLALPLHHSTFAQPVQGVRWWQYL